MGHNFVINPFLLSFTHVECVFSLALFVLRCRWWMYNTEVITFIQFQILVAMWREHGQTVIPRQTWGPVFSPWRKEIRTHVSRQKLSRRSARKVIFLLFVLYFLNVSVWACLSYYPRLFHIRVFSRYFVKFKNLMTFESLQDLCTQGHSEREGGVLWIITIF